MTAFKDKDWQARFNAMGDEAENVFEVAMDDQKIGYTRYGLNRPPLRMGMLPARLRYTPDYLCSAKLVEVQGCGRDQIIKLKLDKWGALHWWSDIHPVDLFVWDATHQRFGYVTLADLDRLLADGVASLDKFPEGKTYFAFPADAVFDACTEVWYK